MPASEHQAPYPDFLLSENYQFKRVVVEFSTLNELSLAIGESYAPQSNSNAFVRPALRVFQTTTSEDLTVEFYAFEMGNTI
jgi:hypothetical protein